MCEALNTPFLKRSQPLEERRSLRNEDKYGPWTFFRHSKVSERVSEVAAAEDVEATRSEECPLGGFGLEARIFDSALSLKCSLGSALALATRLRLAARFRGLRLELLPARSPQRSTAEQSATPGPMS